MCPSGRWGPPGAFYDFFLGKTHFLITDFKRALKQKKKKKIHQRSTFPPLRRNVSLRHPFLFLPWLWQNKPANRSPGINYTVDTRLYLGDTRKETLERSHWVSWRGTKALCPLDLSLDPSESQIEKVCVWLSQCHRTFIFIRNVPSLVLSVSDW